MIKKLKELNQNIEFYDVFDEEFSNYGRVINDIDASDIISAAKEIKKPETGSIYVANELSFENLNFSNIIKEEIFGEMPIQVGLCHGHSNFLNAAEWHTSSEVNVAVTDFVLILGHLFDIKDNKINSKGFKAFYVPQGTVIEVYATSLHFCPCEVENTGFSSIVVLPKGTNIPLEREHKDKLLFRKNKWIISHIDNQSLIEKGVVAGIFGENYEIKY
ncbi:MAG: DUF4867 family protein [Clostridia bacterium]|nr:DUF4867 family protein [Clostridia bacterium]